MLGGCLTGQLLTGSHREIRKWISQFNNNDECKLDTAWNQKQQLGALFMDVKGAFDCVIKSQLLQRMIELKIPNFLIKWTDSFLTNRQAQLVIDGFTCQLKDICAGVP